MEGKGRKWEGPGTEGDGEFAVLDVSRVLGLNVMHCCLTNNVQQRTTSQTKQRQVVTEDTEIRIQNML